MLHMALRIKSLEISRSMSDLINEAIKCSFPEDEEDLVAFEDRADGPLIAFEDVLKELKMHGGI